MFYNKFCFSARLKVIEKWFFFFFQSKNYSGRVSNYWKIIWIDFSIISYWFRHWKIAFFIFNDFSPRMGLNKKYKTFWTPFQILKVQYTCNYWKLFDTISEYYQNPHNLNISKRKYWKFWKNSIFFFDGSFGSMDRIDR